MGRIPHLVIVNKSFFTSSPNASHSISNKLLINCTLYIKKCKTFFHINVEKEKIN